MGGYLLLEAIRATGLTKRYGEVLAVDNISFSVEKGMIFGFLGPNGAGKSTTQRILTGVVQPDHGEVRIMGYHMQLQPLKAKQATGVVPELANVYVDMTAWDNLMFTGEVYGVGRKARSGRAAELLDLFGLYEKRHLKTKGFSKGMKQRLLLCMALINDPEILFLDEPTSGLDVQSIHIIRNIIRQFNGSGKTVFLTTHNIEEVSQLCDLVAIINRGRLAAIDRPENLKRTLQNLQLVEVAFNPQLSDPEMLYELEGVKEVKKTGDRFVLCTDQPGRAIFGITDLAHRLGLDIMSLQTLGPTLEDVFLHLTGQAGQEGEVKNAG